MDSKRYWELREEEALRQRITDEKEFSKRIDEIYANMLDEIDAEIERFYGRYATSEGISLAEAKKRVSRADIKAYERKAAQYVKNKDFSKQANEEMRLYNATMKINRLELLKANIGLEMIKGHAELEAFMDEILQDRTLDELKRQAGILGDTVQNNAKAARAIVNGSFSVEKVGTKSTFSDRIWHNHDVMRQDLGRILQTGLIQGKNPRALTADIRKYWYGKDPKTGGGARYCAERLMRTELARVQTEAQKLSFERMGFDEYEFIANSGCCDACQKLDGKHFKVKDMMPGENAAPLHPNCRCSCSAYEDSDEYEAWIDYLSNGGTTEEWQKNVKNRSGLLDFSNKSRIIKINIDELTPCLRRLSDNKIVDTQVVKIKPKKSDFKDWEFDWSIPSRNGYSVYGITANGDPRIQGLIALKEDSQSSIIKVDIAEAAPFNNPHNSNFKEKEYNGVGGHLFAEAVRQSYEAGFDGAVYFTAKSNLIEHYEKELGAILIDPVTRVMFIDENAAKKLYDRYYGGK